MRRTVFPTLLLAGTLIATACAGGEEMGEAQPSDMDVAAASELECYIARGTFEETQDRPSPLRSVSFAFDGGTGLLCYGAPSARGREVMGELVPYDQPWRIGANEPTTLHLSGPANVGGVMLEPGSYSLYAIPGEQEWQFLVNSNWERWGIPIDGSVRASEIGSFTAPPESTDATVETLTYTWQPNEEGTMGDIVLAWENTRVAFHVHPGGN